MTRRAIPRIVVVGGGFAGVEAALTLRATLGEGAAVTVVSAETEFTMRPDTVYLPFGASHARLCTPLAGPLGRRGVSLVASRVDDIDPRTQVLFAHGEELPYDFAVLATGATARTDQVPGLARYGASVWSAFDMQALRDRFLRLRDDARRGVPARVLFVIAPHNDWPPPLYELALMLETWLRRAGVRDHVELRLVTHERGHLRAFGQRTHDALRHELAARGIDARCNAALCEVESHAARFADGTSLPFDLLVAAPPYASSTDFRELARDSRGFALVDQSTRRALGSDNVFVVGDASDFPVKQAVLALLQADTAAETIAAAIERRRPRVAFDPTTLLVVDELDSALFAQVPLHLSDTPSSPLQVVETARPYLVGTSPAWRLGRRAMSVYLGWRLRSGKPFQAGVAWQHMQQALHVMERAFAH